MRIRIDVIQDKQVVLRFTRKYKCSDEQAHNFAQRWGRKQAQDQGIDYTTIHTKTMEVT